MPRKKQIAWVIKHRSGFAYNSSNAETKKQAIFHHEQCMGGDWKFLYGHGDRCVKVELREIKGEK